MKNLKTIIAFAVAALLLCSCVDTPDNLKGDGETVQTEPSGASTAAADEEIPEVTEPIDFSSLVERGNLEVIRSQLDSDLKKTYKNIAVKRARVGTGETMPTYDIDIGGNPDYDIREFADYLYADFFDKGVSGHYTNYPVGSVMDDSIPAYTEPTFDEKVGAVRNINVHQYGIDKFVMDDGFTHSAYYYSFGNVWGSQTGESNSGDLYYYDKLKIVARYDLDYDTLEEDIVYKMTDGGEWSIAEAVEFMEDIWETYFSTADPVKFSYTVKTVWVLSTGDDSFGYLFEMQRQDENGNYCDVEHSDGYVFDRENQYVIDGDSFIYTNTLMSWCLNKEELTRFIKDFSFDFGDITDNGDNLLSLGAAADILSNTLAKRINRELTAELNYVAVCKGYPYYSIWEYPYYSQPTCLSNCEFELRPMWCFKREQCTLKMPFTAEDYFVDAVTGDVCMIVNNKLKKAELDN